MNHPTPTDCDPTPYATPMAVDVAAKPRRNWVLITLTVLFVGPIALMVAIVFLLAFVAALGGPVDHEQASIPAEATLMSSQSTVVAADGLGHSDIPPNAIRFNGQIFTLKFANADESTQTLHEYVPEGETLDRWSKMIAFLDQPIDAEPIAMARAMADSLLENNPQAPYSIWDYGDGLRCGIDFATWQGDIAEFNVFVLARSPNGKRIVSSQYAERAYGDQMKPFLDGLPERRLDLILQASTIRIPGFAGNR
ncbi:hypothetical protein Enr13x_22410 [Stieleria neptunia]|uniref:Uncharacterized protein n=1 Tax=Stieleria neptunia TaxID=2527979 RepID=A0A518HNH3_9BACT|nr:hypothetical protein [Stieleria neptunia]QDV42396.1 hypothetical protein Enr13x_22410 [Stieleria neptunia]